MTLAVKAGWRVVQRHLGILDDGDPDGPQTLAAVADALGVKLPTADTHQKREPEWLIKARSYVGLREIKGPKHEAKILRFWESIKAPFRDDETPWCAAFVGAVLEECGIKSTRSAAARSYLGWGKSLKQPRQGAVVVFWRGSRNGWSGHVGFVVGVADNGDPWVLGGNQGDAVNVRRFPKSRVLGYQWPAEAPPAVSYPVRRINSAEPYSTNEA